MPIVAALAGGAGSAVANKALGRGGGKSSNTSPDEQRFLDTTGKISDKFMPFSEGFMSRADESLGMSQGFWKKLMEMDPHTMAQVFGPEIAEIQKGKQRKIDTVSRFAPRGGERDRALTEARTGAIDQITRLFSTARPMAAEGLSGIAGLSGSLGLGSGELALGGARSGLDYLGQLRGLRAQQSQASGEGIGQLIGQLLPLILGGKDD